MKLSINEIIGLNTLLDGEKIWGFPKSVDKSEESYVERTAEKIMSHGKERVNQLLTMLNQYKKSGSYIMINEIIAAKTENGWVLLVKEEESYDLFYMDHEILDYALRKEIEIFQKRDNETEDIKKIEVDFLDLVETRHEQIGKCIFFCKHENYKLKEFNIVYELDGKRNIYNLLKKENYRVGDVQIEELIRRYTKEWER